MPRDSMCPSKELLQLSRLRRERVCRPPRNTCTHRRWRRCGV